MLQFAARCDGLVNLQLTFSYPLAHPLAVQFDRYSSWDESDTYDPDDYDDEHSRDEERRRQMGTIDHRVVAARLFAAAPSLLYLGLSLHGDCKMDFWVPDPSGTARKCKPIVAMRKCRLLQIGTRKLTCHY